MSKRWSLYCWRFILNKTYSKKLEKRFKNEHPFICVYMFGALYNALPISEVNDSQRPMCLIKA